MRLLHNAKGLNGTDLERFALCMILLVAAGLRLWGLDQNGFANNYYAAAVRSMMLNVHNFHAKRLGLDSPEHGAIRAEQNDVKLFSLRR